MLGYLNKNQIDYILLHLNHHFELHREIYESIVFCHAKEESNQYENKIIFLLTSAEIRLKQIKYIGPIPILYPITSKKKWYYFDDNGNLIFSDDLIKSAFYLLSGAQELELFTPDTFHRFPYKSSLQYRLNIADTPVVNEYFEVIRRGIKTFCEKQHLNFRDRRLWGNHQFGALMTHDVDRVNRWTIHETKLRIKQILGFKSSPYSRKQTFRLLLESILRIFQHYENDPYWTFDWIKSIEQEYGVNSTWYFLPQRELHADAYYSFTEERIKNLVDYLSSQGDEVGLHATYASPVNYEVMKQDLEAITTQLNVSPLGIRQHRLSFVYPTTLQIYERLNITYDTSWSFAEHVGWRNSYCLPFKPYDLENDRIMDLWEVPLCLMDKTAFEYQDNGSKGVYSLAVNLVDQAKMYHGMLVLLWHNHYFDEIRFPGIKNLYKEIFNLIEKSDAKWITPGKILQEFESIPLNFSNTVLNISAE